ncbi:MAG: type IV pilin [Sphingobacteriaceae bacterium]|nr:type IV pilin [Sphingobacteriaceae bacterium]
MKLLNIRSKKNKGGFSLIELLLVVGFIALVSLGVYTVYSKVQTSQAANTEARNLDTIRAGIKNLYGASQNYVGLTNVVINDARVTPDSMRAVPVVAGAAAINNTFGGAVTVVPVNLGTGANNGFQITYAAVPGDVCTKLVTTAGRAFDTVGVGAVGNVKAFGTGNLNVVQATATCAGAGVNGIDVILQSL